MQSGFAQFRASENDRVVARPTGKHWYKVNIKKRVCNGQSPLNCRGDCPNFSGKNMRNIAWIPHVFAEQETVCGTCHEAAFIAFANAVPNARCVKSVVLQMLQKNQANLLILPHVPQRGIVVCICSVCSVCPVCSARPVLHAFFLCTFPCSQFTCPDGFPGLAFTTLLHVPMNGKM